jgi:PKD repeat protein
MRKLYSILIALPLLFANQQKALANDIANFNFSVTPGNLVFFTNTTTLDGSGPRRAVWSFGDGATVSTGPLDNTQHGYSSAGTYTVCLRIYRFSTANNDSALTSQECKTVVIQAPDSCAADFERIQSSTANPLLAYFRALPWHNNNKHPEEICWHFGDGSDTCIQYDPSQAGNYVVSHHYQQNGIYNVCVRIRYQGGCIAEKCKPVQIGVPDSCSADFEVSTNTTTPLTRKFTAQPWNSQNKRPVRICWRFGDGTDTCIQYTNSSTAPYFVYHTYASPGIYEVCVKILYDGGCEATKCRNIQAGTPDECRADFERIPTTSTNDPFRIYFRALPWNNNNRKPQRICWEFGDGRDTCIEYSETFTGQYVVAHHYNHTSLFNVCVRIRYYGGCEAGKCKLILVNGSNDGCHVRLFESAPSITSLMRSFYIVPATLSPVQRICWRFGDGADTCIMVDSNSTQSFHITHTYPGPGIYHACVQVLFASGCVAEDCHEVVIRSLTGICGGYMTDSLNNPHTVTFRGFSIHNPNDEAISYRWTFGDGSTGTGQTIVHTYNAPGVYRVCLIINTRQNCETRICNDEHIGGTTQSLLQLSPNPVVNNLHALFFSTHNEIVSIRIVNASGIVVRSYTRTAVIGANNWDFDLASLTPGIYSFVVQSPNQFASAVFFKQ